MYAQNLFAMRSIQEQKDGEERTGSVQDIIGSVFKLPGSKTALIILGAVFLIFLILYAITGGMAVLFSGNYLTVVDSTYLAPDQDILEAEETYKEMEEDLQEEIERMEEMHPGFDEYHYELDEIKHSPWALTSFLSAREGNFRYGGIEGYLEELFRLQYEIELIESEEIRYTEPENEDEEPEPYTVKILTIKLINNGLENVVREYLNGKQLGQFELYQLTKGNRPYLFDEEATDPQFEEHSPGIDLSGISDERVAMMLAEADKYEGTPYVWGGSDPRGFDCSGFVCYVINHSGGNVGRVNARTLYANSTPVSKEEAKPGDLIFFKNTHVSGLSHVGIYCGDGIMIHAGSPVKYANINTNYWQEHFLGFTRLS